jgi:hypothetical protein
MGSRYPRTPFTSPGDDPVGARALLEYASQNNFLIDNHVRAQALSDDESAQELAYAEIAPLIAPAKAETIILLRDERDKREHANWLTRAYFVLGPVPAARWMTLLVVVLLAAFVSLLANPWGEGVSDPPEAANQSTQAGTGETDAEDQTNANGDGGVSNEESQANAPSANEGWFLATVIVAATLGASFSGLFQLQTSIQDKTYTPHDDGQYTLRVVSGALAGTLLWLVGRDAVDDTMALAPYALAILGGYGAAAVARILSRLVEGLETAFSASVTDQVASAQKQAQLESEQRNVQALRILAEAKRATTDSERNGALEQLWRELGGMNSVTHGDEVDAGQSYLPLHLRLSHPKSVEKADRSIQVLPSGVVVTDDREDQPLEASVDLDRLTSLAARAVSAGIPSRVSDIEGDGTRFELRSGDHHVWFGLREKMPPELHDLVEELMAIGKLDNPPRS